MLEIQGHVLTLVQQALHPLCHLTRGLASLPGTPCDSEAKDHTSHSKASETVSLMSDHFSETQTRTWLGQLSPKPKWLHHAGASAKLSRHLLQQHPQNRDFQQRTSWRLR